MARILKNVTEITGATPIVDISRYAASKNAAARLVAKLEYLNPAGSAKDRVALELICDAERRGVLTAGATVIEPTSGNTGIGLASVAAARGYRAVIVMPDSMSAERRRLMAVYGAEVVLTPGAEGMAGAVKKARELQSEIEGSFIPDQFSNPANAEAHFKTTGPEIWEATGGEVDIFVSAIGTGGTVTGVGRYLKSKNPAIKVVGVEPAESPLLTEGRAGAHKIQGIGANFVPAVLERSVLDEIITVKSEDAFAESRALARAEGFFAGISSGAALCAAAEVARREENRGKTVVVFLPDGGERYISAGL